MSLVKTVEMRVLAKAGDAQAKLDELAAKGDKLQSDGIKMRFRVEDGEGKAQLDAIKARADALGFKDVTIKVKVDGKGRAIADLEAIKHEEDSVGRRGLIDRLIGGAGGGIPGSAGIPFAGGVPLPALAAAVPVVGALATELVGVVSGFAAAAAGAGAFAALAMPAFKSVIGEYTTLQAAQKKYHDAQAKADLFPTKTNKAAEKSAFDNLNMATVAFGKMSLGQQNAVTGIQTLVSAFGKMSRAFQPQAFMVFADGLKVINGLLPHLTPFANTFAQGLDGLLQKLGKFTQSKGFSDWLKQFHSLEGPAIQSIGTGIGNVANAFGKLMTTMSGKDVAHSLNILFGGIAGTINVVSAGISRFMKNFDGMKAAATSAVHGTVGAFKSMAAGVEGAVSGVIGAWKNMVHGIEAGVSAAVGAVSKLPGQIKALFADAAGWLVGAGKNIILGLIHGIESMAGAAVSAAEHVASGIWGKVKSFFHMGSPSRLMFQGGGWIIEGLGLGMMAQIPALKAMADKAAKVISDRIKAEITLAKSVTSSTISGLGLTSIDLSQTTVAGGMQSYLASIKAFITEIKQLTSMHLNKGILQQLIQAGPVTGGQYAQNILQGGVGPVNALYKQIQQQSALLGAQAAMSMYGGKVAPKGDTYTISVQAGLVTDKQALALEIVKILRAYKRHNGGASLGLG